jgi:hypothetical protein
MGGTNKQDNLVALSPREHYIAHWLLTKFTIGQDKHKMLYALHYMAYNPKNFQYYTPKIYAKFKNDHSIAVSLHHKKMWSSDEYKKKMLVSKRLSWSNGSRNDQREYMKNNSPFRFNDIHAKSIKTRTERGTNIWLINNPMKNPEKAKIIASKRAGHNHYLRLNRKFFYRKIGDNEWIEITDTLDKALTELGFSRSTFMKMIHENYRPKSGALAMYEVKREML